MSLPLVHGMENHFKPFDVFTNDVRKQGFQCDQNFWDRIVDYHKFAQGVGLDPHKRRLGVAKTPMTRGELIAHVVFVQWQRSAMLCKKTRCEVVDYFGGLSPMIKKPCVGFGCAVCQKYEQCKTGEYEGELDPFPQVTATGNYQPMSIEELEDANLFMNQQHLRKEEGDVEGLSSDEGTG